MTYHEYYVGHPCGTGHIPFRIGEGFMAPSVMEARRRAVNVLKDAGLEFGYLCMIEGAFVTMNGTVCRDGTYSRYLTVEGANPSKGREWEWRRIPSKKD